MKTHLLLVGFTLLLHSGFAQTSNIDSLYIIPSNPSTTDTVYAVCRSVHTSGGCSKNGDLVSKIGSSITVVATHNLGVAAYICWSTDTIMLGRYSAGNYTLQYTVGSSSGSGDQETISFTVDGSSSIDNPSLSDIQFIQGEGTLNLDLGEQWKSMKNVTLYNIIGAKVSKTSVNSRREALSTTSIGHGVYILSIELETEERFSKKIFIHQ